MLTTVFTHELIFKLELKKCSFPAKAKYREKVQQRMQMCNIFCLHTLRGCNQLNRLLILSYPRTSA